MANSELTELQTALLDHLALVGRLRNEAAEKRKAAEAAQKAWILAEKIAKKEDRKSRVTLSRLLQIQLAARTGRLDDALGIKPPPIRRNRETKSGQQKTK
jgi:hypothetical protein